MTRRVIVAGLFVIGVLIVTTSTAGRPAAQESTPAAPTSTPTPLPTPTAYPLSGLRFGLLARADIVVDNPGEILVSAATIQMPPGAATLNFTVDGDTVIAIQTGMVTLEADNAAISVVDVAPVIGINPVAGTPGPVSEADVPIGQQIFLPAGATASLRNNGSTPATVLVLAVSPAPQSSGAAGSGQ